MSKSSILIYIKKHYKAKIRIIEEKGDSLIHVYLEMNSYNIKFHYNNLTKYK